MIPFVKWAGGKRQLIDEINKRLPDNFNRYYEPFVGAGAVFLELGREGSVINDFNEQLINVYKQIKRRSKMLMAKLDKLAEQYNSLETKQEKADMYYDIREKFNEGIAEECLFINGLTFVWITDGICGWKTAHKNLKECFDVLEHLYNFNDLENGILKEILK